MSKSDCAFHQNNQHFNSNEQTYFPFFHSINFSTFEQLKKYARVFALFDTIYFCNFENKYREKYKKKTIRRQFSLFYFQIFLLFFIIFIFKLFYFLRL